MQNPIPQGIYVPATRFNDIIFTAGMTPRKNGVPVMTGKVKAEESLETYRPAADQATDNAVAAAMNMLKDGETIAAVLDLKVYINAEEGFTAHAKLANLVSERLVKHFGEAGISARAAVGMGTLPGNMPLEVQIVCGVKQA